MSRWTDLEQDYDFSHGSGYPILPTCYSHSNGWLLAPQISTNPHVGCIFFHRANIIQQN